MEYKLQTPPNTPERERELGEIELLRDEDLSSQISFYSLVDGVTLFPDYHPTLRSEQRFKNLNNPFRMGGYTNARTVGELMAHRWSMETVSHKEWVRAYTRHVLPYTSLVLLMERAVRDLQLEPTAVNRNFILNSLWVRIFTQTEEGFRREFNAKQFIIALDGACDHCDEEAEFSSHIDFISPVAGYQVKTPTFLQVTSNAGLRADQLNNLRAQKAWSEAMQLPVFYLVPRGETFLKIRLDDAVRACALDLAA